MTCAVKAISLQLHHRKHAVVWSKVQLHRFLLRYVSVVADKLPLPLDGIAL